MGYFLLGILLIFGILLFVYGVSIYNRLVRRNQEVQEGWSGIDVQLRKRYDLIPNLVETVKGYASHEKETFKEVTRYRTMAQNASTPQEQQEAENLLTQSLRHLFAVAENYPELRANENFLDLQRQLAEIETGIEKSRRYYNAAVRDKNILVESFPSSIVAAMYNFEKSPYFELDLPEAEKTPEVRFR